MGIQHNVEHIPLVGLCANLHHCAKHFHNDRLDFLGVYKSVLNPDGQDDYLQLDDLLTVQIFLQMRRDPDELNADLARTKHGV
ncbi:hypothetical protein D3C80_1575570 [compost metagenome]